MIRTLLVLMAALVFAGCANRDDDIMLSEPRSVEGTVTYRDNLILPPDAEIHVLMLERSRADNTESIFAMTTVDPDRDPTAAFELMYDDALVDPRHEYYLASDVTYEGFLFFTTRNTLQIRPERGMVPSQEIVVERTPIVPLKNPPY